VTSEPERWLDGAEELDAALAGALESAGADFPSEAQLAAVEASLLPKLGPGGGGGGAAATATATPVAPIAIAAVATLVVGAGIFAALGDAPAAEVEAPVEARSVAPPPEAPNVGAASAPTETTHAAEAPNVGAAGAPTETTHAADGPPLDEGALLERARRLVRSDPDAARAALDTHRARFPDGVLTEERQSLAVELLHRSGETAEARAALTAFAADFPGSVHLPRLRALVR